jgi:hypothetical protein
MRNCSYIDARGDWWIRVSKRTARRLHDEGMTIAVAPCNASPVSMWATPAIVAAGEDLDRASSDCQARECRHGLGRYPSYYATRGPRVA